MTNPLNYRITSLFGIARTYTVNGKLYKDTHDGVDFAYPQGTPVTLPPGGDWDGVVVFAGKDQFGGNYVDIKADKDGGVGRFLHLSRIDVKRSDRVVSNQRIGLSGGAKGTEGAGLSTGAHLHIGLFVGTHPVDPLPWLKKAYTVIDPAEEARIIAQTEAVKAEPAIEVIVGHNQPGISYVLRDAGVPGYAERWVWETVGQANGFRPSDFDFYNANLKVGDKVRIPTRLLPEPVPVAVETPTAPQPEKIEENTPAIIDTVAEHVAVEPSVVVTKLDTNPFVFKKTDKIKHKNEGVPEKSLPIWLRSVYDTARDGSYAVAGILIATGGWDMVQEYILTGDFSEVATQRMLLGVGAGIAGYIQAIMKEERKKIEKK